MNVQRDDGRGNEEKKIQQRVSGDGGKSDGSIATYKELIVEIYGLLDKKDQEISELTMSVKKLEEAAGMIMESFQIQLDAVKEEVKRASCCHMEKEKVAVPKVTVSHPTTTVKEPMKKMEEPWKTVSVKKTDKKTNKSASTVKDVLPQIPPNHQNIVANAQASYLQKLKQEIKTSVNPASLLLKKEKIHSDGPIMLAVIEDKRGKAPLSISVISTSTAQILFKEEDLPSF
jgi:gas vesicle protein